MPRGRRSTREQQLADTRRKLEAVRAEQSDLDAAEALANRRFEVADRRVAELWGQLATAQANRDEARDERAVIRTQRRRVRDRIRRFQRRITDLERGRW